MSSAQTSLVGLPRRSIDDLVALYQLHPDLPDYYVEGRTDRLFLEYILQGSSAKVIEVNDIEIPLELLRKYSSTEGARQRVVALATELHGAFGGEHGRNVRCIVDADFDRLSGNTETLPNPLRFTDYSCMESYWFDDLHLEKYVRFGLRQPAALTGRSIVGDLAPVMRKLFSLRAAGSLLLEGMSWLDPTSCLVWRNDSVSFNETAFVGRWLNKNSAFGLTGKVMELAQDLDRILPDDPRHSIHGHDLVDVLSWYMRRLVGTGQFTRRDVVERTLASCCDRDSLSRQPLLGELIALAR
jgi:hypothetical protein